MKAAAGRLKLHLLLFMIPVLCPTKDMRFTTTGKLRFRWNIAFTPAHTHNMHSHCSKENNKNSGSVGVRRLRYAIPLVASSCKF